MYESKYQPLASRRTLWNRVFNNAAVASIVIIFFLLLGTVGYYLSFEIPPVASTKYSWIDAFHNASMILSGMGPVVTELNDPGKIFSSFYALFSGVIFLSITGFILAPIIHRFLHKLHIPEK